MFRLAAAALILTLATPAYAGWQGTEWGQSVEEVLAFNGARLTTAEDQAAWARFGHGDALVEAPYRAGYVDTEATFFFQDDGLAGVMLQIDGADASETLSNLRETYGNPPIENVDQNLLCRTETSGWRDANRGNLVEYRRMICESDGPVSVKYTPLRESAPTGF